MAQVLQRVVINATPKNIRFETLEGQRHLVVPTVMIVEGVLPGSDGPLLYRRQEMRQNVKAWDHKPLVVYHPTTSEGKPKTASDPLVLNTQKVGVILRTRYVENGGKRAKLKTESWINEEQAKKHCPEVLEKIQKGQPVEVSTGLYTDLDPTPGKFEGKEYKAITMNYVPDHLAILPTGQGACTVQDGAGLLQNAACPTCKHCGTDLACANCGKKMTANAMSHSRTHQMIQKSLDDKYGEYTTHVADVYPGFVVYGKYSSGMKDRKLYKHSYKADNRKGGDGKITLSGDPEEVQRVTEYRTPDGVFVGNSLYGGIFPGADMDKKTLVTHIIANSKGQLTEEDREWLERKDEKWLTDLPGGKTAATEQVQTQNASTTVTQPIPAPVPVPTFEELLAKAPKPMQDMINNALADAMNKKASTVAALVANKANKFTQQELESMDPNVLYKYAASLQPDQPTTPVANYMGAGGAAPVYLVNGQSTMPKLPLPPSTLPKKA